MGSFANWLEGRKLNITKHFTRIIKVFKNFKLMQDLREEIERVKNPTTIPTIT